MDRRKDESGTKIPVSVLAKEVGYSEAHYFRLQDIGKIEENILLSIPGIESLVFRDIAPLCKAWKTTDGKESIIKGVKELDGKKLSGKAAVEYLLKSAPRSDNSSNKKISIKVPGGFEKKDLLVEKLKALGAEFGIEFNIK